MVAGGEKYVMPDFEAKKHFEHESYEENASFVYVALVADAVSVVVVVSFVAAA